MRPIAWTWQPGVSVGPFRFGADATPVIEDFGLRLLEPDCPGADWDTYEIPRYESRIHIENNLISSIGCWDSLIHEGKELLRRTDPYIQQVFGSPDDIEWILKEPRRLYYGLYYHRLGLTLWIDGGIVKSTICEAIIED